MKNPWGKQVHSLRHRRISENVTVFTQVNDFVRFRGLPVKKRFHFRHRPTASYAICMQMFVCPPNLRIQPSNDAARLPLPTLSSLILKTPAHLLWYAINPVQEEEAPLARVNGRFEFFHSLENTGTKETKTKTLPPSSVAAVVYILFKSMRV